MTDLERRALARVPLNPIQVHHLYCTRDTSPGILQGHIATLCESHTRLQQELEGVTKLLAEPAAQVASREAETRLLRINQLEQALKRCAEVCANHDDYSPQEACRKVIDTAKGMGVVS